MLVLPLLSAVVALSLAQVEPPRTAAELTDYKSTMLHREVVEFCEQLTKLSPNVKFAEMGRTVENRPIPLLILADPPVATPEEARRSGKLVVFAMGGIHAGEICGKEALCMLARDLTLPKPSPLFKDLIILFVPIFNSDGNERVGPNNRPGQVGPENGMGIRTNANGLDLNRDFVKLDSPEVRSLVRLFNRWDPAIVVDTHTTNGSRHQYTLTYDGPRHASASPDLVSFVRDELLPTVRDRVKQSSGYALQVYGNFSRDRKQWDSYEAMPRYGVQYVGLRNRIGILSEAYAYAPFKDRVQATYAFTKAILEFAAEKKDQVRTVISKPHNPKEIALRQKPAAHGAPLEILGYVEKDENGKRVATKEAKTYTIPAMIANESTLNATRPAAYIYPPSFTNVTEVLQRHGIQVEIVREDVYVDVETSRIDKIDRAEREYQRHKTVAIEAKSEKNERRIEAGSFYVATAQPLGNLAVLLLEAQTEDGLATWNFFDQSLEVGKDFPVVRLAKDADILRRMLPGLPEDRKLNQPVRADLFSFRGGRSDLFGTAVSIGTWLPDGEHYLQMRGRRLMIVEAKTGKARPFHDPDKMAEGFAKLDEIDRATAAAFASRPNFSMSNDRTLALFSHENDLYVCAFDGSFARRLTATPGEEELPEFSPDGKWVAYVRDNNLFVVGVRSGIERALTTDGNALVSYGKADWVYFEEIFNRNWKGFWWSPDSKRIALMRFDDTPLKSFTVLDHLPLHQTVETTKYPKAGDPNPLVQVGTVSVVGGPVVWLDLSTYTPGGFLVSHVGWKPDGSGMYCYIQDRAQTWLDFVYAAAGSDRATRFFRDATKAWIENAGETHFLKDGSFLYPSERSGWKHFYHYSRFGKLQKAVTSGEWEARGVERIDEEKSVVYVVGTKDNPLAENLYAVPLTASAGSAEPIRLTDAARSHQIRMSAKGPYFVDSSSNPESPTQVRLCRLDGTVERMLDANPVFAIEEYRFSKREYVKIPMSDGFELEGTVLLPPDLDRNKKYPVWLMTYAGPHTPTVSGRWNPSLFRDQIYADLGIIIFRVDPRSASGKGACSAWTAYRQLGVQELKDLEAAVAWLIEKYPVDAKRVGISGHSYGGFMTAYALTHSKVFSAGISGAPVTDWRNYDSIYTERFMNTPQENPEGYQKTSVVEAAANLHGKLLLIHGIMDDNVHVQNSIQFIDALQRANKSFEVMLYPRARHGIFGEHYSDLMHKFILKTMLGEG